MSETVGTPHGASAAGPSSTGTVHEAYSFACLSCGYGWEQSYEIRHPIDEHGHTLVTYYADGRRVPSPLTRPSCGNCGRHRVRIMRSGRVSSTHWSDGAHFVPEQPIPIAGPLIFPGNQAERGEDEDTGERRPDRPADHQRHRHHHWLADLLAIFRGRRRADREPTDRAA